MNSNPAESDAIIIRADAGSQIGSDRLIRCLALAEAWDGADYSKLCVTHCPDEELRAKAEECGVTPKSLAASWPDATDLDCLLAVIRRFQRPWVVLDGNHFDAVYQRAIREAGARLLIVDDNCDAGSYDADVILNSAIQASSLPYECDDRTKRLFGPSYALLRPEFVEAAAQPRSVRSSAQRILITIGGADPVDFTSTVFKELDGVDECDSRELETRIVVDAAYTHFDLLKRQVANSRMGPHVTLLRNVANMAEQMLWADLTICALGGNCWELAATSSASVLVVIAGDQRVTAATLRDKGAADIIDAVSLLTPGELGVQIAGLMKDSYVRNLRSSAIGSLVDGRGAERVIRALKDIERADHAA